MNTTTATTQPVTLDLESPELHAALVRTLTGTGRDPGYMAGKVLETLAEQATPGISAS